MAFALLLALQAVEKIQIPGKPAAFELVEVKDAGHPPFWIGKHEVTWDEFDQFAFVGNTGARTGDQDVDLLADAESKPSRAYGDEAKGYGKAKPLGSDPLSSSNRRVETRLRVE